MKPYRSVPIVECGDPLVPIPPDEFGFYDPPPYLAFGAPYSDHSPWMLRRANIERLRNAKRLLEGLKPGWKLMLFDAYRPNAVQRFMVEREFHAVSAAFGYKREALTDAEHAEVAEKVFRIWGVPSENPLTPPPHSTGGAVDLTLVDEAGNEVPMGSPIDENSDRSLPDYFAPGSGNENEGFHANRDLLRQIMVNAGFVRHHAEWWHFSRGDQYWAWRQREDGKDASCQAEYGRGDLLQILR